MIVPSQRLLVVAAVVALPAATMAGLSPALFLPGAAVLLASPAGSYITGQAITVDGAAGNAL